MRLRNGFVDDGDENVVTTRRLFLDEHSCYFFSETAGDVMHTHTRADYVLELPRFVFVAIDLGCYFWDGVLNQPTTGAHLHKGKGRLDLVHLKTRCWQLMKALLQRKTPGKSQY